MKKYKPLEYGEELKLEMKDHTKRVVTVLHAREQGARVQEFLVGIYDLEFDEVLFVHDGDDLHTAQWLKNRGRAHVERIQGAYLAKDRPKKSVFHMLMKNRKEKK